MADFLQKYMLTAGTPVTIDSSNSKCVAYDFTNNSPFDVDIIWGGPGKPTSLSIPPTTVWRGARPASALLIPGNQWGGIITATPSNPGGGTPPTNLSAAQLTVHGYEKGNDPPESITNLNTQTSIGGGVLSQATSVIQDGTAYPKTLVESSPSNYPSLTPQSVNLLTDGTLTLVTPSNGAFTPAFKVVPGSAIGGGAFSHIEADNGQVLTDGVGNTTLKTVKAQAPVKLAAGSQETGYCSGLQNNVNNTGTTGGPANFKTTMTNIPSSITVNVASSSNAPAPTAGNITLYGFSLFWTPTAAGNQSFVEATYVTVGN